MKNVLLLWIKRGSIFLFVACILVVAVSWALGVFNTIGGLFGADQWSWRWKLVTMAMFVITIGAILSSRWLKSFLLRARHPLTLSLVTLFFGSDEDGAPFDEVMFRADGRWVLGLVVSIMEMPADPYQQKSAVIKWYIVLGPLATPIPIGSQVSLVPEFLVVYTGRKIAGTSLSLASLCAGMKLDYQKFVSPEAPADDKTHASMIHRY